MSSFAIRSLPGLTPYAEAHALQLDLVDRRVRDEIPDTLLFLEHTPVVTRGRGLQIRAVSGGAGDSSAVATRAMPLVPGALPAGVDYVEVERGGDLTYHGPGQLVFYPIFKLDGATQLTRKHELHGFLRGLERITGNALLTDLATYGYAWKSVEDATGVWVERPSAGGAGGGGAKAAKAQKIASLGIAVRKWVTFHGVALNCVNDLKPFTWMSPCGFSPEVMTSWADCRAQAGAALEAAERTGWRAKWEAALTAEFKREMK